MPAAPTPVSTIFTSSRRFPTTFRALTRAASVTIAVPCWSSWKTGMSSPVRRRSSISKQRGAEMSSRLMPPNVGATAVQIETISSTSVVARQSGNASTPANSLKSAALPSITGIAASGPMSPRPSTAVPSETTATVLRLIVRFQAASRSAAIASQTRATPGVYAIERSSRVLSGILGTTSSFPPRCRRNVRSETCSTSTPSTDCTESTIARRWASLEACTVTSRTFSMPGDPDQVDRVERPTGVADRLRDPGERPGSVRQSDAQRRAVGGGDVAHALITPSAASAAISLSV